MAELVKDHPEQARYEIEADGERAGFVQYRRAGRELILIHTETDPRFRGRGLAVLPSCPFARAYIADHREYLDLVPAARRAGFGL